MAGINDAEEIPPGNYRGHAHCRVDGGCEILIPLGLPRHDHQLGALAHDRRWNNYENSKNTARQAAMAQRRKGSEAINLCDL